MFLDICSKEDDTNKVFQKDYTNVNSKENDTNVVLKRIAQM